MVFIFIVFYCNKLYLTSFVYFLLDHYFNNYTKKTADVLTYKKQT